MNKTEILIIDDEPQIRKLLQITLESNGYKVLLASNAAEGLRLSALHPPAAIILDLGLPDKDGHQLLKELREWYGHPIIILSVRESENDVVEALDNGATDYLSKPFRAGELLARIRSAIRQNLSMTSNDVRLVSGQLVIDLSAHVVTKNDKHVRLTSTEYQLLVLLVRNEGRVLTHQYLLREIWGVGFQTETQYLRVFIAALRKKIEDDPNNPVCIITESGIGYRFQ